MNRSAFKLLFFLSLLFCFPFLFTKGILGNFGDIYLYVAPFRNFSTTSLQTGSLPLWNPYIFAGSPFLATPQSALFYPLNILFSVLPLNYAVNFFAFAHIFLLAIGMVLLLYWLTNSQSTAVTGSVIWTFSFFFLAKLPAGHIIHLSGFAWSGFLILLGLRAFDSESGLLKLALGIGLTLQFFSGHLQVWLVTFILLVILFLAKTWKERKFSALQQAFLLFSVFLCLALVQILPTAQYLLHSSRFLATEIFPKESVYDFATSYSMTWRSLMTLFLPNFLGNPIDKTFVDPDHPSVYFESNALYFGFIPVVFALAGLVLLVRKRKFFLPAMIGLFLVLCMGKNGISYRPLWEMFGFLRVPARFYFLCFFGLVLCFCWLWRSYLSKKSPYLKLFLFALIVADLFFHARFLIWSEDPQPKLGKSAVIEELQQRMSHGGWLSPYRICTTAEIPNPNKTMFYRLENLNGYEAVVQGSLLNYFAKTQGTNSITTTGIDIKFPAQDSFFVTSTKYLVTTYPFNLKWPVKIQSENLKVYENPDALALFTPFFSIKNVSSLNELFSLINEGKINLKETLLCAGLKTNGTNEDLKPGKVTLVSYSRKNPDRIATTWKSEGLPFWLFFSQAHYPGWEVWTLSGKKLTPFPADGYFQAVFFSPESPKEKLYWLFRPKDFLVGLSVSVLAFFVFIIALVRNLGDILIKLPNSRTME